MMSCMRSKTECKTCKSNKDGFCVDVEKNVDDIVKQWKSSQRSRAKRKIKDNASFFTEETINKIVECAEIIKNSPVKSKEQIDAMNNINAIFYRWKTVDTDVL